GQEIGGRDAPAMIVQEVLRDPGGGPVDHQTHQGGRGEGVDLHVVDEQAARTQAVGAPQLLVGTVAAPLDRGEDPGQVGAGHCRSLRRWSDRTENTIAMASSRVVMRAAGTLSNTNAPRASPATTATR